MTVRLKIWHHEEPRDWNPRVEPIVNVCSSDNVEAWLSLANEEKGGEYFLQMGNDPDIHAQVVIAPGEEKKFHWHDRENNRDKELFSLFRGGLGTTDLLLIRSESGDRETLAKVSVEDKNKERFYNEMRADLFNKTLPHFIVDDYRGQMEKDRFSLEFNEGFVSCEDKDVMLEVLQKIIESIAPLLKCIAQSPVMCYETFSCRRPLSKISHLDRLTRHAIMRSPISFSEMRARNDRVFTSRKRVTTRMPVHAAIRAFLVRDVLQRLVSIRHGFEKVRAEEDEELKGRQAEIGKQKDEQTIISLKRIICDKNGLLLRIDEKIKQVDTNKLKVLRLLRLPIFLGLRNEFSIYDLCPVDFMATEAYRKLYNKMVTFLQTRFWWVHDEALSGRGKMPQLKLDPDTGETRLQKKYSIVYEMWCYSRLIHAMIGLDYRLEEGQRIKAEDCSFVIFKKDHVKVELRHGIVSRKAKRGKRAEFTSDGKLTPDFAIIVYDTQKQKSKWIVADSKSDSSMKSHMVDKRNKYANIEKDGIGKPLASVLFWSGESKGNSTEISFPPRRMGLEGDHSKDDYEWKEGYGIIQHEDLPPYHGDVRANVESDTDSISVFQEFMSGMIKTALREME